MIANIALCLLDVYWQLFANWSILCFVCSTAPKWPQVICECSNVQSNKDCPIPPAAHYSCMGGCGVVDRLCTVFGHNHSESQLVLFNANESESIIGPVMPSQCQLFIWPLHFSFFTVILTEKLPSYCLCFSLFIHPSVCQLFNSEL